MKRYKRYMDGVDAPDALRQRLVGLETPERRSVPWKKYGAVAAALVLVVGMGGFGAWAAHINGLKSPIPFYPTGYQQVEPEMADAIEPDIAPIDPGDVVEPGEKTIGGYEVRGEDSGPNTMVSYYMLPYIDYGNTGSTAAVSLELDWDIPANAFRRNLDQTEIAALMGGEDVLSAHLDWSGYELTGWGAWYEEGPFWGAYIQGHAGPLDHFEFAVTADQLPPTCFGYPTSVTQEIRGLTVTADGYDGKDGCSRRVSFMKDDYGYLFELTATGVEQAELLVSRLVRQIADEGLALAYTCPYCGHTFPFGVVHNDPIITAEMVYTCSICGQTFPVGTVHNDPDLGAGEDGSASTEPYDPREAADPAYSAPAGPDDITCSGYPVPAGPGETYTCPICGAVLPADVEHAHGICGLPLAPSDTAVETIYD